MAITRGTVLFSVFICTPGILIRAQDIVPVGTPIIIRLEQTVSSKDAKAGQKIDGTVAQGVVVGGRTLIPRGSRAKLSVTSARPSGRLKDPATLWLKIRTIEVRGKQYPVDSRSAGQTGPSHTKRNVAAIGGTSAAGAVIGAIAGGGKGAAIGAAAGAGAGTAGAAATGKKEVVFPVESKLRFSLRAPLRLN